MDLCVNSGMGQENGAARGAARRPPRGRQREEDAASLQASEHRPGTPAALGRYRVAVEHRHPERAMSAGRRPPHSQGTDGERRVGRRQAVPRAARQGFLRRQATPAGEPTTVLAVAGSASERRRLLLVRHGQTAWHLAGRRLRSGGRSPRRGRARTGQAASGPAGWRAHRRDLRQSAGPRPRHRRSDGAGPRASGAADDDLLEFDFGAASGSSRAVVKLRLRRDHLTTPVPGGESLQDV